MNSRPYSTLPPGRTSWWKKLAAFGAALALFGGTASAQYCNSAFSNVTYEFITNVNYAGINNTSGGTIGGPVNYTSQVANVTQGGVNLLSVTIDPDALDYVWVFIDWNQNLVLNDAGEVYVMANSVSAPGPYTMNVTVPIGAVPGNTRMRAMCAYNSATPNPCASLFYGEAEDYTVNVAPAGGGGCSFVTGLGSSGVTGSSATISWTCTGCTGNYVVEYGLNGFTPGAGATAGAGGTIWTGAPVASSPVTITGLSSLTGYTVYVRQNCSGTYSANIPTNFTTTCGGSSCSYSMVLTDNYSDGWNGGTYQVLQNGVSLGTFGTPNLPSGCGPITIPLSVCSGSTLQFKWLTNDSYSEDGLRIYDPFGVEIYNFRGASIYPTNCPGVTFTGTNPMPTTPNTIFFTTTANCTPPACSTPTAVTPSAITATSASVNWTCSGCTGTYIVEYGLNGFTPGINGSAGAGGTILAGSPFSGGPVSISGLSSSTTYKVAVRQQCPGGSTWSGNSTTTFSTSLDCPTSPIVTCGTPTTTTLSGAGVWNPATSGGGGVFSTPGQEKVYRFTAPTAGIYVLSNTTSTNTTYIDFLFKSASGSCDQLGWTYINDVFGLESANFTIPAPGDYYILADEESTVSVTQTWSIACPLPCATPQFPFAQNLTSTSTEIAWSCTGCTGNSFTVEYGLNGFTLGTGTQVTSATSPATITGLSPTTNYQAYVRQDCGNVGDGLSNWSTAVFFTTLAPPPANDDCVNAVPVSCGNSYTGSNVNATNDGVPSQASGGEATVDNGVWYVYTPSVTGEQVTASTCAGTAFDTRIHVFQGACGSLIGVAGADDICGVQSTVTWNALPGTTYYIAVEGYGGANGTFNLAMTCGSLCSPFVTNDLCVNRTVITMGSNCIPFGGNLSCATNSAGNNPACIGGFNPYPDAYYEFVATAPDAFVTLSGGANLYFMIYNNTCTVTAGTEVYCSAAVTSGVPTLVTGLTTGNTYVLRVMELQSSASTFSLCVQKLDISDDPCAPVTLACNDQRYGRTVGRLNNIPADACPFNGAASTGGVNYWSYTALADEDVTFSTCGLSTFDSRISVFEGSCTSLSCTMMNDNAPGCPSGSSTVQIRAVTGTTYTIMVHGAGAAEGDYQLIVFCEPYCSASVGNDLCSTASSVTMWTEGDPMAVMSSETLVCSYLDGPTSCSDANAVQGVWFDLTTNANNTDYDVYIATNTENAEFTASTASMALFSGSCSNTGASGEMMCVLSAGGTTQLPPLTPSTTYRMLVYNQGALAEGTFGLQVTHPGYNDGGISEIAVPNGTVCDQRLLPVVTLTNHGEASLSSAQIISRIDGDIVQTYNWSGPALATGESTTVTLPEITSPVGIHTYTAEVSLANGQVDELSTNSGTTSNYDATGQTIVVTVRTDNNPQQTSWAVYDPFFFPVATGGPFTGQPNQTITSSHCLATTFGNCFYFFVFDQAGDGIVGGSWNLTDSHNRNVLQDNGVFGAQSPSLTPASPIYFAHEFCLPLGPSPIQAAECNVFNNYLNNKVYTTAVAGVTNYQFEFSDPNAGFYRRISLPRNWVKFGEMVSTPLVYGTTYYCRARADQGAAGFADDHYGPGCEMAMSASQPICTELMSTPGPTFSCGATKRFGGSDKIWAQPVTYATQYRFSFVGLIDPDGSGPNPAVNTTRIILRTSYVCPLNWATYTLVSGQTYNVSVECFVGGTWTGYCGAVCPLTIQNPPGMMQEHNDGSADHIDPTMAGASVSLWPNPAREGRVNLMIGDLTDDSQMITVDIYDAFGKRVMTQHYENSGNVFNKVLDLDASMAAGNYVVNITVNDERYVKRLNVVR
jgi:hypothetical protein